jgi:hypothetical protein
MVCIMTIIVNTMIETIENQLQALKFIVLFSLTRLLFLFTSLLENY